MRTMRRVKEDASLGHYVVKMREDWEVYKDRLKSLRTSSPEFAKKNTAMQYEEASCDILLGLMEASVCWTINKAAFPLVWNTQIESLDLDNCKLPFPQMAIEYLMPDNGIEEDPTLRRVKAPKRVILLSELDENRFSLISAYKAELGAGEYNNNQGLSWWVSPLGMVFKYEHLSTLDKWYSKVYDESIGEECFEVSLNSEECPLALASLPMYEEALTRLVNDHRDYYSKIIEELMNEVRVAFGLLGILACSNAPTREIKPSEKLNKKREASGRISIPPYRTLHISDHVQRNRSDLHADHASPRAHWRRGHIRNQNTAKGPIRKWIRPTIVNPGVGTLKKPEVVLT